MAVPVATTREGDRDDDYGRWMSFDEGLAARVRDLIADQPDMSERKMFGGLRSLRSGNMCFGIVGGDLMVRVGSLQRE